MSFKVGIEMIGSGLGGVTKMRTAVADGGNRGLLKAIALVERHHKRVETIRGTGDKGRYPVHPTMLTMRHGGSGLSGSYTRAVDKARMLATYGSDKVYAPVHEYGSAKLNIPARPGLERTAKATAAEVERIIADEIAKGFK